MIRRRQMATRLDDRTGLWLIVGLQLIGFGGGLLVDALTPLDFAAAFYRQATWPIGLLPAWLLGAWILSGGLAVLLTFTRWGTADWGFSLRVYGLCWLTLIGVWYARAGFVYGVMQAAVVVGVVLSQWRWQPRETAWRG